MEEKSEVSADNEGLGWKEKMTFQKPDHVTTPAAGLLRTLRLQIPLLNDYVSFLTHQLLWAHTDLPHVARSTFFTWVRDTSPCGPEPCPCRFPAPHAEAPRSSTCTYAWPVLPSGGTSPRDAPNVHSDSLRSPRGCSWHPRSPSNTVLHCLLLSRLVWLYQAPRRLLTVCFVLWCTSGTQSDS